MIHNQQAMGMGGMPGAMRGPGPPGSAMPQQPWPPSQPTPMTAAMPYPPHTYPALPGMMNQTVSDTFDRADPSLPCSIPPRPRILPKPRLSSPDLQAVRPHYRPDRHLPE